LKQVMENPHVPEQVRAAVARHERPTAPETRPARRGDLAVVSNEAVTRIVCVTKVADTHLVAVLCSNEVEMATDHDVIVHRQGTYDLLLEAECYLVVLQSQVHNIVGTVDLDVVNAIRESLRTDGESVESCTRHLDHTADYTTGSPLGGINDPRRAFMEQELDDVIVLRDLAHRAIFDDGWNPGR
jgi:hypothetical protein